MIYTLLFVNNYAGTKNHMWSVAVEIQMYIISPFIIQWMYTTDRKKVWLIPAVMCVISTILCFIVLGVGCPEVWTDGKWSLKRESIGMSCGSLYDKGVYKPSPTRISPYGFGMFCAYLFLEQVKMSKE